MNDRNKFLLVFTLILFACSSSYDNSDKTIFRYNEAAGISSLDPAFAKDLANIWACNQIYSGLVKLNDDLQIEPSIAKSWTISDDAMTYTFLLRNDVYFHNNDVFENGNGRRVNASDFEYSFNRIVDANLASPGLWVFNNVENIDGHYSFVAINDSVFQIKLNKPFPAFLGILAMQYCAAVPHEAVNFYRIDFRQNPVGAGPFMLKLWKEGTKMVLVKNENYYEKDGNSQLPYLDAISITFLIDRQSAFLHFIQGNLDLMSGIDASYKDELLTIRGELKSKYLGKINMISQPYLNTEYLGILVDEDVVFSPLKLKAIRQAINYGFDREKMMKYLRNNIGEPGLRGIIPRGLPSYDNDKNYGYTYDPDKARKLLTEAGFPNGEGLPPIKLSTNAEYLDLCEYIQYALNEIGFDIQIDVNPPAALRELKAQAKLAFFRASWIADYPDAENYLSMFYSNNFCPNGPNYTHFKNEEFDRLYEESLAETDDSTRFKMYSIMDSLIMDESPVVILYYDQVLRFVQPTIEGLGSNAINLLDLTRVKKIN